MVKFNNKLGVIADASGQRMPGHADKTRVYIADEQVLLRRGLASVLQGERDLELCGETSNCTEACAEVCQLRPDVVIIELLIDGERGIDLIGSIKAIDSEIRVVVFSQLDEKMHAMAALEAGASAYVSKQAPPHKVLDAIRKVRDGQLCVSDRVAGMMLDRFAGGQGIEKFSPDSSLSSRELEVFKLLGAGLSNREIAEQLDISMKTVETHRAHIKVKANLTSGFELLQLSTRWSGAGIPMPA